MMDATTIRKILEDVRDQRLAPEQALDRLRTLPFEDIGITKIDHHRKLRLGLPEVIYAAGKTPSETAEIFFRMAGAGGNVLATRATAEHAASVAARVPGVVFNARARTIHLIQDAGEKGKGTIAVLCAGTSDIAVAEEAAETARVMGNRVELISDVGVAGLHRLLAHEDILKSARVFIVCAGMEGALPSVVAGLVSGPVIAVPTSVGYGASFGGMTALLAMLNSCAPNVVAVNIDNGFGAGYVASIINRL